MNFTRRQLLQALGLAAPASVLPACFRFAQAEPRVPEWESPSTVPWHFIPTERYFVEDERRFVAAAVDRLIPEDDMGPGGVAAGVVGFIDRQLAGPFGRAARWYMQGPWRDGTDQQGYQLRLTPAEVYRHSIPLVNEYCRENYDAEFADLSDHQRDEILTALEQGNIPLELDDSGMFFELLLQNSKEGFLADPMYGGNRDFAGWRMIGFPGPRYDYEPFIENYGEPYPFPPVGLLGRTGRAAWEV
jgi:gluconate 2-dehydrogenase gamma chain